MSPKFLGLFQTVNAPLWFFLFVNTDLDERRHDIQHNDIWYNDTQNNNIQYNDTQHNSIKL